MSMFFGVGEVLTAVLVVAGVYFVGQQVKDILESLVGFVRRATTAQSEPDLEAAAKLFAHALTLSVDIVVSLLRRKARPTGQGSTVLRAKASGGSGGKRPVAGASNQLPDTRHKTKSPIPSQPKGGVARANAYGSRWRKASLQDAINKFAPGAKGVPNAKGDKVIYPGSDGKQVVYDPAGNYFRIEDTTLPGKRKYLDMDGNLPNNKVENGKQTGRNQSEYDEVTHYGNTD